MLSSAVAFMCHQSMWFTNVATTVINVNRYSIKYSLFFDRKNQKKHNRPIQNILTLFTHINNKQGFFQMITLKVQIFIRYNSQDDSSPPTPISSFSFKAQALNIKKQWASGTVDTISSHVNQVKEIRQIATVISEDIMIISRLTVTETETDRHHCGSDTTHIK